MAEPGSRARSPARSGVWSRLWSRVRSPVRSYWPLPAFSALSLSWRLFLLTSAWAIVAVVIVALVIGAVYRRNVETRFAEVVAANLYNLMGVAERGADGRLTGTPDLRDPRYRRFRSGWYWQVERLSGEPADRLASLSLGGGRIPDPPDIPFDAAFQRQWSMTDEGGQPITVVEARAFLGAGEAGDDLYSFRVTGNRAVLAGEIAEFTRSLVALLAAFALGFILVTFGIVRFGLAPIAEATRRLAAVREGRASGIDGRYPQEITPLIEETNALIESNRAVVERARTQVGNLAHSLKTPLAVLRNEAAAAEPALGRLILDQTGQMQQQVQTYLDRARIAARTGVVTSRVSVGPVLDRLVEVIGRLHPALDVGLSDDSEEQAVFAGERQDFEEIAGNLLENAARHARSLVRAGLRTTASEGGRRRLVLLVEDDGPGMTPEQAAEAVKRGARLDESTPGSGLGLSIITDICREYGGALDLSRSPAGGLAASVTLPAPSAHRPAGTAATPSPPPVSAA